MRRTLSLTALLVAGAATSAVAFVGSGHVFFGTAGYELPGNNSNRAARIEADVGGEFGGVDFGLPAGLTIDDLDLLSTDTLFPAGSTCGGGSPRFQIRLAGFPGKNIFVYIGPPPSYTGCPSGVWSNTGNLLSPASIVDTGQLPGGTPGGEPWSVAQARYSGEIVTDVFAVTDTFAGPRTVVLDNTNVNGTVHDYEFDNKEDCKKNGWQLFTEAPGPFKNQGQCVSHFAKQQNS